jgi:DNA-binding GntR family transcriptional regulator
LNLKLQDVKEIYQIRGALESLAVKIAIEIRPPGLIDRLKSFNKIMTVANRNNEYAKYFENDASFHEEIINASQNLRIKTIISSYTSQVIRIRFLTPLIPNRLESALEEHNAIIKAMEERDIQLAVRAITYHIEAVLEKIEKLLAGIGAESFSEAAAVAVMSKKVR